MSENVSSKNDNETIVVNENNKEKNLEKSQDKKDSN